MMMELGGLEWYVTLITQYSVATVVAIILSLILRYALGWLLLPWADELRDFQELMQELIRRSRKNLVTDMGVDSNDIGTLGRLALGPAIVQAAYWIGMVMLITNLATPHG